ncbi:MAG: hypothetical protein M3Q29_03660 [Chloroflexota bacterium]|nr:hypothetical protein [Chloroflexota bacterium]
MSASVDTMAWREEALAASDDTLTWHDPAWSIRQLLLGPAGLPPAYGREQRRR